MQLQRGHVGHQGFAASGLCVPSLLCSHRSSISGLQPGLKGISTLACRHARPVKHFGLPSPSVPQARGYMTEGQLLGTAFMLSTDIMFWCVSGQREQSYGFDPARVPLPAARRSGLIGAVVFRCVRCSLSYPQQLLETGRAMGACCYLRRRNLIVMLLATEIVMLACNLNFLFASAYLNDMTVSQPATQQRAAS